ncbi:MAG TPA: lysophospholipid acyltransferase family protein [Nitrospinota bacterium]|nr:lysophospholipid acyltransferase family protein [Nitrospinota bacterium]
MSVRLLSFFGYLIVNLIGKTLRIEYINKEIEESIKSRRNGILAFWHGRLLLFGYIYKNQRDAYMMISQSRDGELISGFTHYMGIKTIRGSSSRGGKSAFINLARQLKKGYHAAITPDGPRGPRYKAQRGTINLAKISEAPIVPVTYNARRKKIFNSWDRFLLPLPFSKVIVIYGEPIIVPKDADNETIEGKRLELEKNLNKITEVADKYFEKRKL